MIHDFYVCCEAHLREIADEAIRNALTEHVARIRADEREQAAQRVINVDAVGLCHPCAYDKATFVAAARGEDAS